MSEKISSVAGLMATVAVALIVIFIFGITGCTMRTAPVIDTVPGTPIPSPTPASPAKPKIVAAWDGKHVDSVKWTEHVFNEVMKSPLVSTAVVDAKKFNCSNLNQLSEVDRAVFWTRLIAEKVRWESSFKPESLMRECRKDKCVYGGGCFIHETYGHCMKGGHKLDGGIVISRGLPQMSLASSIGLGCGFKTPQEIHAALPSLSCVIKGLSRYVPRDLAIGDIDGNGKWDGASAYWAVFRGTNDYTRASLTALRQVGLKTPKCN